MMKWPDQTPEKGSPFGSLQTEMLTCENESDWVKQGVGRCLTSVGPSLQGLGFRV